MKIIIVSLIFLIFGCSSHIKKVSNKPIKKIEVKKEVSKGNPVYSFTDPTPCLPTIDMSSKQVCLSLNNSKKCHNKERLVIAKDYSVIYCSKFLHYGKNMNKNRKIYHAMPSLVDQKMEDIKVGNRLIAYVSLMLHQRKYSLGQIFGIFQDYKVKTILSALQVGSLDSANDLIEAYIPDEIFSSSEIATIHNKLKEYRGLK